MSTVVIKDKADFVTFRVVLVQFFQEDYKVTALMRVADVRNCFPRQQINSCKQRDRSFPNIFVIPLDNAASFDRAPVSRIVKI